MHSRIFAFRIVDDTISPTYEKLDENIDFDLVSRFADYVKNSDGDEDIKWLLSSQHNDVFTSTKENGEIYVNITKEDLYATLDKMWDTFITAATDLKESDFIDDYSIEIHRVKQYLCGDDFGFWFCLMVEDDVIEYTGFENELSFFRNLYKYMEIKNLTSVKLRFEGSLDYHN